jgi:hypothetical protein
MAQIVITTTSEKKRHILNKKIGQMFLTKGTKYLMFQVLIALPSVCGMNRCTGTSSVQN